MRWLTKYPITAKEILKVIESIPEINPSGTLPENLVVGGVDDFIRERLIDFVKKPEIMVNLLENMK